MNEKEKLITAYHEGRACPRRRGLPGTDPVQKVTILPRGRALGYTMVLPEQDKYASTRAELLDQLAYMMGGRAAEAGLPRPDHRGQQRHREGHQRGPGDGHPVRHDRAAGRHQAGQRRRRTLPRSRLRAPARLLRGHRGDRGPGGLKLISNAHQRRSTSSAPTARCSTTWSGAVREGDPGPGGGRRGVPAAQAVAEAPGLDGLRRPGPVRDPPVTPPPPSVNGQNGCSGSQIPPRARRRGAGRRRTAASGQPAAPPQLPGPGNEPLRGPDFPVTDLDDVRVQVGPVSPESPLDESTRCTPCSGRGLRPPPGRRRGPEILIGIGENPTATVCGTRRNVSPGRTRRCSPACGSSLRTCWPRCSTWAMTSSCWSRTSRCGAAASTTWCPSPGSRRLHPQPQPGRSPAGLAPAGGPVRQAASGAGAAHHPGRRRAQPDPGTARRDRGDRVRAPVHDHARRPQARLQRSPARSAASSATPPPAPRRCS